MDVAKIRKSFLKVDTVYLHRFSSELHNKVDNAVKQSGPDKAFEVDVPRIFAIWFVSCLVETTWLKYILYTRFFYKKVVYKKVALDWPKS